MTLLTEEVRAFIGREVSFMAPEELGRAAIRYFATAIGDNNPLYTDDEFAKSNGYPSVIAPPTLVCETNQFVPEPRMDDNGYIGHLWDLPVTDCLLLRGGNAYTFERPVLPSDRIMVTWRVDDITERESSSGAELLLLTSVGTYTNQDGELLATNRESFIYQKR